MFTLQGKYGEAIVHAKSVDDSVIADIISYLNHPVAEGQKIRIMPDVHAGKGSVIGFTATIGKGIIPQTIGVDIGCGVLGYNIGPIKIDIPTIDAWVKENIPRGINVRQEPIALDKLTVRAFVEVAKKTGQNVDHVLASLGTLGGGNHFIEIGKSSRGDYWLFVHSGSRNFGYKICQYHQKKLKKPKKIDLSNIPPRERQAYLEAHR